MNDEILTTFDAQGNVTGTAPRNEVHRQGLWHETFHCWFVRQRDDGRYIYLQLRSKDKRDYAGLLDITAAGHLLAHETAMDGIREVEEELGLEIAYDELIPLGIIPYSMVKEGLIDNERANVFLYDNHFPLKQFQLQKEEVAGIVMTEFSAFRKFWQGELQQLEVSGFRVTDNGERIAIQETVDITHFVPHDTAYYLKIIAGIEAAFS
ncbi:NUDIX hydrolase [Paenibacillus sp. S150]|uniref:NUDIX hydrolase n=1 Tax=Paenibacillus sp. S150 TaxID=2749826 RepID=UPI001C5752E0|nr:NUDIX hydrolase [Paenibacillus sp. S150]MBW4080298.1 NUDIX hydrolase [Paenibacillus sp. S150]